MLNDEVNHPSHYTMGEIECLDAIKASMSHTEFLGYLKGASLKYQWRYQYKGKPHQDIDKALFYLHKLREELDSPEFVVNKKR
tara:strand:+ start:171 stop:419 length:249 start_codon:yes stop_codon:yes gene_type:complete